MWDYNSRTWESQFLDDWCGQTVGSRLEPMKRIARSLRKRLELSLNYFQAGKLISRGVVDGLNNKAKVTMKKSYGFRTYRSGTGTLSHTWQTARTRIHLRFTSDEIKIRCDSGPERRATPEVAPRGSRSGGGLRRGPHRADHLRHLPDSVDHSRRLRKMHVVVCSSDGNPSSQGRERREFTL